MEPTPQTTIETQIRIEIESLFNEFIEFNSSIENPIYKFDNKHPDYFQIICTDFIYLSSTMNVKFFGISKYTQYDICIFCKKL